MPAAGGQYKKPELPGAPGSRLPALFFTAIMKFASVFGLACAAFAAVSAVPITHDEIEANSAQGLRLLSLEEGVDPVWKTEDEKLELMRAGVQFVCASLSQSRALHLSCSLVSSTSQIPGSIRQPVSQRFPRSSSPLSPSPRLRKRV